MQSAVDFQPCHIFRMRLFKSLLLVGGNTILLNFSPVFKANKTGVQSDGLMQPNLAGFN